MLAQLRSHSWRRNMRSLYISTVISTARKKGAISDAITKSTEEKSPLLPATQRPTPNSRLIPRLNSSMAFEAFMNITSASERFEMM